MIKRDEIVHIGNFKKPHGIKGEISATIYNVAQLLTECRRIIVEVDGIFVPFFINDLRNKSQDTVLMLIDGIENENQAATLVNHEIYLLKEDFDSDDNMQLPVDYFNNFEVLINGIYKGIVQDIDDSTANLLFVIKLENGDVKLIPVADDFVTSVDTSRNLIELEVPDSLLDL